MVLGGDSTGEAASPENIPPAPTTMVTEPAAPPAAPPVAPTVTPTVEAGPIRPIDAGVLTERESQLVSRCADAGWMSLCLPDDRRAARSLRDKEAAYLAVRREVARLLGEEDCDAAVRAALDGGYLGLARETRDYCAAPAAASAGLDTAAVVPASMAADEAAKAEEPTED